MSTILRLVHELFSLSNVHKDNRESQKRIQIPNFRHFPALADVSEDHVRFTRIPAICAGFLNCVSILQ